MERHFIKDTRPVFSKNIENQINKINVNVEYKQANKYNMMKLIRKYQKNKIKKCPKSIHI